MIHLYKVNKSPSTAIYVYVVLMIVAIALTVILIYNVDHHSVDDFKLQVPAKHINQVKPLNSSNLIN
jgi:hypothetical protein